MDRDTRTRSLLVVEPNRELRNRNVDHENVSSATPGMQNVNRVHGHQSSQQYQCNDIGNSRLFLVLNQFPRRFHVFFRQFSTQRRLDRRENNGRNSRERTTYNDSKRCWNTTNFSAMNSHIAEKRNQLPTSQHQRFFRLRQSK